ncbi:MAG: TrkH family potassium uptake protein [Acidobacteria bacterium]|nr:TrkH family potassium uptake protein [Acidobacteriota bacterium]
MIRITALFQILGLFLLALAGILLIPLIYSLLIGSESKPFLFSIAASAIAGSGLYFGSRRPIKNLSQREGILLVVAIWIASGLFGCLPFYLSPHFHSFTDAFFEAMSGFTTTGATVLADVEVLDPPLQLWRCSTHWFGGMGIVLLGIAILPLVGMGGMPLYRAEFSGAKSEKLKPRITETALALWRIYFSLTLLEYLALRLAGMGPFDAVCHTLSTMGTGGFSTRTASIAAFNNPAVEAVIIVFMLLAGINFVMHYRLWVERKPRSFFSDIEIRFYLVLVASASALIFITLLLCRTHAPAAALRDSLFQASSIMTTTGFVTANFEVWHSFPQLILLALMFIGGCTGSTAGGMKSSRILMLLKVVGRECKQMVERKGIFSIRLGSTVFPEHTIRSLLNLLCLAFVVNSAACLLLALTGVDALTSIAAVIASMFNIGPGFGGVGPVEHYGHLPYLAKWILGVCMLAGRLEFYAVFVILTPAFWRS